MTHEVQPRPTELTNQGQTSYSRGRSNFMANEGGEAPKPSGVQPDARQAAREYVASLKGRQPSFEESQALRLMEELGLPRIGGGSGTEPPEPGGPEQQGKPRRGARRSLGRQETPIPTVRTGHDPRVKYDLQGRPYGFELSNPTPEAIQQIREQLLAQLGEGLTPRLQQSRARLAAASEKGSKAFAEALVAETEFLSAEQAQPFIELEYANMVNAVRNEAREKLPLSEFEKIDRSLNALDMKDTPAKKALGLRRITTSVKTKQKTIAREAAEPTSEGIKRTFKPSTDWQEIPSRLAIPEGATVRMDMATGKSYAKWDSPPDIELEYEEAGVAAGAGGEGEGPLGGRPTAEGAGGAEPDEEPNVAPLRDEDRDKDRGGTATATAEGGTKTPSLEKATEILNSINLDEITDGKLSRVALQAKELVERHSVYSSQIDRLITAARDMDLAGANREQYLILIEKLSEARAAARRVERYVQDPKQIEEIAQHPQLLKYIDEVSNFIAKAKEGSYDPEEYENLKARIDSEKAPGGDRFRWDPDTKMVVDTGKKPGDYTADQFQDFEFAKALLKGNLSDIVGKLERGKRSEEFEIKAGNLAEAIRQAATSPEDDTPETKARAEAIRESALQEIEKIIGKQLVPERPETYSLVIEEAIRQIESNPQYRGEFDRIIEFTLEYSLERILSQADEQPQEEYPQFNLYVTDNIDRIVYMARVYDEDRADKYKEWYPAMYDPDIAIKSQKTPGLYGYLVNLRNKRRIMHELFRGMKDPNTYLQLVTGNLRKTGFKFVEKDIVGVSDIQQIYDQVLGGGLSDKSRQRSTNRGWLTDKDFAKADEDVEAQFKQSAERSAYFKRGKTVIGTPTERRLRSWETKRAAVMGRSLNAASQRRSEYAIMGDLPENPSLLYKSIESEYVARRQAPLKLFADRFFGQPLAKLYMDLFKQEVKRDPNTDRLDWGKYGYVTDRDGDGKPILDRDGNPNNDKNGNPLVRGLYGHSQEALSTIDLLIVSPKSNSWRGRFLFLWQEDYKTQEITFPDKKTEKFTIGQYLDEMVQMHPPTKDERGHKDYDAFNSAISGVIADQRLFLGSLMRYGDELDDTNKEVIWKNVAKFIPSRIGAYFPSETDELVSGVNRGLSKEHTDAARDGDPPKVSWLDTTTTSPEGKILPVPGIRSKLWLAERLRVKNDAEVLRADYSGTDTVKEISDFFKEAGLTLDEIRVVEVLQSLGRDRSGELLKDVSRKPIFLIPSAKEIAHIRQPLVAFLDDAPKTDWENNNDEDFNRILVSDQSDFAEGYSHLIGLIADPVLLPDEFAKVFIETKNKIQGPPGIEAAQKVLEPFIIAGLSMRRANFLSKWLGSFARDARRAGSLIEEFNRQARITDNEEVTNNILSLLAQKDVIADNPNGEKDERGRTQYLRMQAKAKARKRDQYAGFIRMIIQLLGPVFVASFIKGFNMKDVGLE